MTVTMIDKSHACACFEKKKKEEEEENVGSDSPILANFAID